jgi:hypothetical protein
MQIHLQDAEAVASRQIDEFFEGTGSPGKRDGDLRTASPLVAREFSGKRQEATEAIRIITPAE